MRPSPSAGRVDGWTQPTRGHWPRNKGPRVSDSRCRSLMRPNRTRQRRSPCYATGEIPQFGNTIRRCWHNIRLSSFRKTPDARFQIAGLQIGKRQRIAIGYRSPISAARPSCSPL
jgi:hypothetical protein